MEAWAPEWWWLAYLALGLAVGFLAGMLGIGGGVVLVPLLAFLFKAQHFPEDRLLHLTLGTSLASIAFTSLSSVRAHHQRYTVLWPLVRASTPGVIMGTVVGIFLANWMSSTVLAAIFTAFVCYASIQLLLDRKPVPTRTLPGKGGMLAAGFGVGALSSLVGVAGGIITIPLMNMCNVPMINCIGTAAAIGLPISVAGAIGYVIAGLDKSHLPAWSLGYVYLPALVGIVVGTFVTVPAGARAAHGMPVTVLKRIFAVVLLVLAGKMLYSMI